MLLVKLILLPGGNENEAHQIGELKIANDGTGTAERGNYDVAIAHGGDHWGEPGDYKTGRVENHVRKLSPYHLLLAALESALTGRRPRALPGDARPSSDTKPCRGCGRPVRWTTTTAGKKMPLDPEPVGVVVGKGSLKVVLEDGSVTSARLHEATDLHEPTPAHVSHFATCPNRDEFRGGGA